MRINYSVQWTRKEKAAFKLRPKGSDRAHPSSQYVIDRGNSKQEVPQEKIF